MVVIINVSWTNVVVVQPISNHVKKTYSWWNQRWLEDPRRYVPGNPRSAVKKYVLSPRSKRTHRVKRIGDFGALSRGGGGRGEGKSYGRFVGALFKRLITGAFLISAINQNFQLALGITSGPRL